MGIREKFLELVEERKKSLQDEGWEILDVNVGKALGFINVKNPRGQERIYMLNSEGVERMALICNRCGREIFPDETWGYENPTLSDRVLCKRCWGEVYPGKILPEVKYRTVDRDHLIRFSIIRSKGEEERVVDLEHYTIGVASHEILYEDENILIGKGESEYVDAEEEFYYILLKGQRGEIEEEIEEQ